MDTSNSPRRRRWFAWALVFPAVTLVITAGVMSMPPQTHGIDIAAGRELFSAKCSWCHSTHSEHPGLKAPNLHQIGRFAATRRPNLSAAEYILESIMEPDAFLAPRGRPGMPSSTARELAPEDIRNLVGYLAGLGASADYAEISRLEIPDLRPDKRVVAKISFKEMQLAENVLREKGSCMQCNSLNSVREAVVFAPKLFRAGLRDADAIRESLLEPNKKITPHYNTATLLLTNGQSLSGQLVTRDDEKIVLCTRDAQNRRIMRDIPLTEIESEDDELMIRESNASLMPEGFGKTLSEEEINALIKLIQQLN